jgi:Skp family chaperone for outer membrane proteins
MTGTSSWLTDLNTSIQSTVDYITNNNYLEYAVMSGFGDVPIAAYGMVIIVLSTLTYATIADPNNITSLSNVTYNMVKSIPGVTSTDSATLEKQFATEKEELKEEEKQVQEEEAEYKKLQEEEEKEKEKKEKEEEEEKEKKSKRKKSSGYDDDDDDYDRRRRNRNRDDDDDDDDDDFLRGGSKGTKGTHGIKGTHGSLKIPPSNKGIKRSTKKRRKIN